VTTAKGNSEFSVFTEVGVLGILTRKAERTNKNTIPGIIKNISFGIFGILVVG
jgi:hypothetical protein